MTRRSAGHGAQRRLSAPRRVLNRRVRAAAGLWREPPPRCLDPEQAYTPFDSPARVIHGDLASMLIGGVASLFAQMLHPHAMAGVAQHSRYRDDPLGRLGQTAAFISATTFGSKEVAHEAIARVREVHDHVHGVADDGVTYDANDPHLLLWVHCCEVAMFLRANRHFGHPAVSDDDANRYVLDMARVARDLGAIAPPTSVRDLDDTLRRFRGELRLSPDGIAARDFLTHHVIERRLSRLAYYVIVRASWTLLDPWARELLGVSPTPADQRVAIDAASMLCRVIRFAAPAVPIVPAR